MRVRAILFEGEATADGIALIRSALDRVIEEIDGPTAVVIPSITLREIVSRVGAATGVSAVEIVSASRRPAHCDARALVVWLARRVTRQSYPVIGRILGGRDHSTTINAEARADALRARDPVFRGHADDLLAAFRALEGGADA